MRNVDRYSPTNGEQMQSDSSVDSQDYISMSRKKIRPKANLSTVTRNKEDYNNSEQNEVADKESYLRRLTPFIDPYEEL